VLTGGAYLHIAKKAEHFCESARSALAIHASTSPSYLILKSLDECNKYLAKSPTPRSAVIDSFVSEQRASLLKMGIVTEGDERRKVVISAKAWGYLGEELAEIFRSGGVEPEFCDSDYTVLMLSEFNSDDELSRLARIFSSLVGKEAVGTAACKVPTCKRAMSIREAVFADFEILPVLEAEGRICASPTVSCPPAVSVVLSGEVIDGEVVRALLKCGIKEISVVKN
jgi:arginine/lysine/ornithine decarboxylase